MKKRSYKTGYLDLGKGFEIAMLADKKPETARLLPIVANAFAEVFKYSIQSAHRAESPRVVDEFSKRVAETRSPQYMRNLRSGLYFILDHSPVVEDLSYISAGWLQRFGSDRNLRRPRFTGVNTSRPLDSGPFGL